MAELFVVNGVCGGTVFFLPDVPTVLGRSPECHIQVADPWISSMHALFERRGDELWVVDLDSRNGTLVDGQRVHEAPIRPGMKLRFGKTTAELRSQARAAEREDVLADQRTIIRYIADVAGESTPTGAWEQAQPGAHQTGGRVDTVRGGDTSSVGSARRQIAVVNEITRALLGADRVEDASRRILEVLSGALASERAGVSLMDERGEMVPTVAEPADQHPAIAANVVDRVLRSRAGVLTIDAQPEARGPRGAPGGSTRSSICAPIWADNRMLGIIVLERAATDPFTADDLELATLVGFHTAIAVERARAVERTHTTDEAQRQLLRHLDTSVVARLLASDSTAGADDPLEPACRDGVAVLAASLVGAGQLATTRPASEIAERVLAIQRAIAAAARGEAAAVEERMEGGIVAVFGLAQLRPDAAAVALRCARTMLDRVTALEAVFEPPRLQLRIGVESGRAVTGNFALANRPELRVVGDAVEAACRLAADAAPGEARAGPGASGRSRRASDEPLEPRGGGVAALRRA